MNAAKGGDTITVDRGTYTEEVVIGKDLSLKGAGVGSTTIKAPATLSSYGVHLPDDRALTAIVRIGQAAHVRISGLTISGPIPCGVEVSGVNVLQGATLALTAVRVTDIQADPATCAPRDAAGRAVVFGTPPHVLVDGQYGTTAFGSITHVTVDHYQHAGISVTGPHGVAPSRVTLADNVITGGWQIPSFQFGVEVDDGAVSQISGNKISGNICGGPGCGPDPINEVQGTGILALALSPGTRIAENRFSGNDVGIYQVISPDCCRISGNTLIDNNYFGIVIQDGDGTTNGNTIKGGQVGIGVVADAVDTTGQLRGDRISGTSVAPVSEIECCGVDAIAIVKR